MSSASIAPALCQGCGNTIQSGALSCTVCGRLTRSSELQSLSAQAQSAAAVGKIIEARDLWQRALTLLPEDTLQHSSIQSRIAELEVQLAVSPNGQPAAKNWWRKLTSTLGPIGLMAWKFKALLLGLTKLGTLFSMFAFFGVYWALYGWAFALGLVLSIYIHEMGHVIEIRSYGLPASAPMFIPGLGAFIRLRTLNITPIQDARIGLAGPLYGLGAAVFSLLLHLATGLPIFAVIAHFGATINLFNLIPVWQLDGSRGFHSLTQTQRGIILGCTIALFLIAHQGMLFLIALGAGYRLFTKDAAEQEDRPCLIRYVLLLTAFALITAWTPLK